MSLLVCMLLRTARKTTSLKPSTGPTSSPDHRKHPPTRSQHPPITRQTVQNLQPSDASQALDSIVVSSSEHAKQVLQKHDHLLSNRFQHADTDIDSHNNMSILWLPSGPHWRDLRRLLKD
ncbi:hypothetical protein ACS0TY_023587 [Phlomoides rotata]